MYKDFSRKCSLIVKGGAILLLLNYHLFEDASLVADLQVNYSPLPENVFLTISKFGNISVAMFVFLTAYGITRGLQNQENPAPSEIYRQAVRRMLLLMGNFFLLFASVSLVWYRHFNLEALYGEGKQGFLNLLIDAAGFAEIFDTPTLNMTWWYMEIAYILIFLVPLLFLLVRRVDNFLLPIVFFIPVVFTLNPDITRYLFTAAVGVCAAYGNWMDKLLNLKLKPLLRWGIGLVGIVLCVLIRQNYFVYETLAFLTDAGIALFLAWFFVALPGSIPGVRNVFAFIGKYSMNIYMVHTFFYMILWRNYIYAFRYAGLIVIALLLASLLYSAALEWIKKLAISCCKRLRDARKNA